MNSAVDQERSSRRTGNSKHAFGLLHRFLAGIVDLLLPPQCAACGSRTGGGLGLCPDCWSKVDFIEPPLCPLSGRPFIYDPGEGILSAAALARSTQIECVRGAVQFDEVTRNLVHGLKYRDRHELADVMSRLMQRAGAGLLQQADVLVPVPLHRRRLWERRFNQSAILAAKIARLQGMVSVDALSLCRARPTRAQVGLNLTERRRNVRGAFQVPAAAASRFRGKRVILVDDVWTTGSTVEACADALVEAGAERVDVLVFAMVCRAVTPGS